MDLAVRMIEGKSEGVKKTRQPGNDRNAGTRPGQPTAAEKCIKISYRPRGRQKRGVRQDAEGQRVEMGEKKIR